MSDRTDLDAVDLDRYPLHAPGTSAHDALVAGLRRTLDAEGCAVLKGFIRPAAVAAFVAEADGVADQGHRSHSRTNPYFTRDDAKLDAGHPIRRFYDRSNAFVPADNFPDTGPLRRLYQAPGFMPFIRQALGEPEDRFFRYDDPLADVIVNMVEEGEGFPWHFDTNNYTVTLAIQNGESGGNFQYVPGLRRSDDENFDGVRDVLDGRSDQVRTLVLEPGDLQIFRGRYALHRVTPVRGARRRYVGIFSFVEMEGMCGGVERTRQLYGRVLPHHIAREGRRADGLVD